MARVEPIPRDQMTAEQIRVNDIITAARYGGQARGPFAVWLRTPEFAELAGELGLYLRTRTTLPRRLLELTVLVTARNWRAQYEWYAHAGFADAAGLDPAVVEDLRLGRRPRFTADDEAVVYDVAREIDSGRRLTDATYQRAVELLGEQTVIDLLTIIGYYTMIAVLLVGLEVDTPDGSTPLPPTER
ncbi:MAG: carboxymuconolactone decarboxylase family protein [Alphaproteobacteria bacterium]|nr:carboxymuconolactone decarboxylase family protein [Alphaproteobacteria bacterium]